MQLHKRKVSNVASWTAKRSGRKQEIFMFVPNWRMVSLFFFTIMSFYIIWVRILEEVFKCLLQRETSEMSYWRAEKCLHFHNSKSLWKREFISVISLCVSPEGLALVRSGEVSVIARCPKGKSQLWINPNLALSHSLLQLKMVLSRAVKIHNNCFNSDHCCYYGELTLFYFNMTIICGRQLTSRQLIGNIKNVKKHHIFHVCCYSFAQGSKSLYNTVMYMINEYNCTQVHFEEGLRMLP